MSGFMNGKQFIEYSDGTWLEYPQGHMIITLGDELQSIEGDTLIIDCTYPFKVVDDKEIGHLMNPALDARMEGNTLYLHYTYERNVKAVFVPIWSFMWQFEHFTGRDLFSESIYGTYSEGGGSLYLWVE
jgi:hypothetical protein